MTSEERLASSLEVLRKSQEKNGTTIIRSSDLSRTHIRRLTENGWIEPVIKGWYMSSAPDSIGTTSTWYSNYWSFIASYCNSRYGDEWSLTAEESLSIQSGCMTVPIQIVIRSLKATNNRIELKLGHSILEISSSPATEPVADPVYGLRIYSLQEAILSVTPNFFVSDPINARSVLSSLESSSQILKIATNNGNSYKTGRIVGALRNIGRDKMADEILKYMSRIGYDIREEDPFTEKIEVALSNSPYESRIRLLWEKMKSQIKTLGLSLPPNQDKIRIEYILESMEKNYAKDAYHSLSIEGYRVTESLIEKVKTGEWSPNDDKDRRDALAARGYYQAFQFLKKRIAMESETDLESDINECHFELFEPCVRAGIISPSDLAGYRTAQVYIRGSRYTPPPVCAVCASVKTLYELLGNEDDHFTKAILGHFFFVYIHPYMDGNGRTARFLMNKILCSSGYPWVVVPVGLRGEYMASLEKASVEEDITNFAQFIFRLIDEQVR